MPFPVRWRIPSGFRIWFILLLAFLLPITACKHAEQTDAPLAVDPLEQAGMSFGTISQLHALNISNAEISDLAKARQAGLSDAGCIELVKLAHERKQPFSDGESVANLLQAGSSERTVLVLSHLNQMGLWAGQAQALRFAGLSDDVILAVARRHSQGLSVLSGETLGALKNVGASDATIEDMVQKGITDQEASNYITQRQRAAGSGFVYQGSGRRNRQ